MEIRDMVGEVDVFSLIQMAWGSTLQHSNHRRDAPSVGFGFDSIFLIKIELAR